MVATLYVGTKLHVLLTKLNVVYVLTAPKPQEREGETLTETRA